ncbi:M20 metallopeptidase family protein [Isachenkonia alkalipeptolytica]|uniref:Amidohydrolase n=1 Tax=Isachenkonia alkalipeptolytica TaxID=2565777 RepID=A0AA43XK47_9CLOT|nr:amidohydrolase [Isachenkonia alkalipeptolytica]NBG87769.1 amidohydrolase [Isachenkonia alkalipeptolytica]
MNKKNLTKVIELRHRLHQYPELSMEEKRTKETLIGFLKEHTKLEIRDRGRWFYAVYRKKEGLKNTAFRADFDAIKMKEGINLPYGSRNPGVAHKCGHDGHAAALVALAMEVDQQGADQNLFFLFQHAEEIAKGARECREVIDEEKIDEIFAFHNRSGAPRHAVQVIDGTTNFGSVGMIIEMKGSPTHASQPEFGKNPAYAIARVITKLEKITEKPSSQGLLLSTVVGVEVGEGAFGIAASEGKLLITFRGEIEAELEGLLRNVEKMASMEAASDGLDIKISYEDRFPVTSNNKKSVDKVRRVAKDNGLTVIELKEGMRGSEDFGYYLEKTRGALFFIGNGENHPEIHTEEYDFPDEIIETAVKMFKGLLK